jgi:glycosyltransferase involved in cell wall biosynthesis
MIKLSVVIPCYNEEKNIPLILDRLNQVINRKDIKIILVNNGSMDNSSAILKELLPKYDFASSIFVPVNQGYGYGILSGLRSAESPLVGWTHADMQTDPYDLIRALEISESSDMGECYIKGLRKGRALFDLLFTVGMSLFETIFLKKNLWDINAQPNIFPKKFFDNWVNPPNDFSLDLFALYEAKRVGLKVIRFPVVFPPRIHGVSSWNTGLKSKWKFIKRTIDFSRKLKKELKSAN